MTKKTTIIILAIFFVIFFCDQSIAQCAMCKQAAASSLDSDPKSLAKNLNTGILYLMAVPYIMIAIIFRKQIAALWRRWRGKETAASE